MFQKFTCYRQTDTQEHTNNMAMLKVCIVYCFPSQKANHYLANITVMSVCVRWFHMLNQLTDCHDMTSYIARPPKDRRFHFANISTNNMVDTRIYKAFATKASFT
jgi:hypothetical protein